MVLVLKLLYEQYHYYVEECKDPRLENYFMMGSPFKILALLAFYLYFVKKLGPKLMENRKPFELNNIMIIYNFVQVVANFILPTYGVYQMITRKYSFWCTTFDFSTDEIRMLEVRLMYTYYMYKIVDLLDTVFFILRKKYSQASFLHIYHHIVMCIASYVCTRYAPAAHASIVGVINCYVHVIMYFYYLLTSINSEYKKNIWWKMYITQVQLFQFGFLSLYFIVSLMWKDCLYPKGWMFVGIIQNLFMAAMFTDFYYRTYIRKSKVVKD